MIIYLKHPNGISTSLEGDEITFQKIREIAKRPSDKYVMTLSAVVWDIKRHASRKLIIRTENSLAALIHLHRRSSCIVDASISMTVRSRRKRKVDEVIMNLKL